MSAPKPFAPLRTKLRPPRLSTDVLFRTRLIARLNQTDALTLVIAPAGYGKTTLAATWLAQAPWPSAWVTLDVADNSLAIFLLDLVTAVRGLFPQFGSALLDLLEGPVQLSAELLLPMLFVEFHAISKDFAVVLDDYHAIHEPGVHQLLFGLLAAPPQGLHVVLCTRHEPPLPPRVRLAGLVAELNAQELSFTAGEAGDFFERNVDELLEPGILAQLAQQADGWAAALRLMAIMARQGQEGGSLDLALRGSRRQLMDYLAAEVIDGLDPSLQRFLERTSILPRMSAPLCDAVVGNLAFNQGGAEMLRQLETAGLFVVTLDEAGEWRRYHTLFRTLMQQRLERNCNPAEIAELHRRASTWFESQGLLEDALDHLLAIDDKTDAIAFFIRHRPSLMLHTDFRRLEHWVSLFSPATIQSSPELLLASAWLRQFQCNLRATRMLCHNAEDVMAEVEADPEAGPEADLGLLRSWAGEAKALLAFVEVMEGNQTAAVAAAMESLALLGPERLYARSFAVYMAAVSLQVTGRQLEAEAMLLADRREPGPSHNFLQVRYLQTRSQILYSTGDLESLRAGATDLVGLAAAYSMPASEGWGHYYSGIAAYLQNDLHSAYEHLGTIVEHPYRCGALTVAHGAFALAMTFAALRLPAQATAALEFARAYLERINSRHLLTVAEAFAAELALRQGRLDEAVQWRRRQGGKFSRNSMFFFYAPQLTLPKVLLAEDTTQSLAEAERQLVALWELAGEQHSGRFQVEILALQAVLHQRQGQSEQAYGKLERALALAAPSSMIRVFVDLVPSLVPVLAGFRAPAALSAFTARIRSAVEDAQQPAAATPAPANQGAAPAVAHPDAAPAATSGYTERQLAELLTFREMDVLVLLGRRLSNKEIAQELGISVETVKQHTGNLFRKLGIRNRRQALQYAEVLDLANRPIPQDSH